MNVGHIQSKEDQTELKENLSYLHVDELKAQLQTLGLSVQAFNKQELIERLLHYAINLQQRVETSARSALPLSTYFLYSCCE